MVEGKFEEDRVLAATRREADPGQEAPRSQEASPDSPEGLARLFRENHRRVFQAAYRITGNAADAEDVLQTVFLRLVRKGEEAHASDLPASYLHLAAINGALDIVRGRTAARSTPLEDVQAHLADTENPGPDARHSGSEMKGHLRRGLAKMNPKAAEIFVLRYLEGYSNLEISRMLRKPQALIAVTLHRARRRLREEIRPYAGGTQ